MQLSKEARSISEWWFQISEEWNRMAMLQSSLTLTSDAAAGEWGCVGHNGSCCKGWGLSRRFLFVVASGLSA